MNEAASHAELIDPALKTTSWGVIEGSRIRREVIAPGRLILEFRLKRVSEEITLR
jgi:type I restriction enzyme, R subunit